MLTFASQRHPTRTARRFKYICGNLSGLGNPLTSYSPVSGHWFSEMFDLLIATWSMAFAGMVYGFVGAMGFVAVATQLLDEGLAARVQKLVPMRRRIHTLAADKSGMDIDEFLVVAKQARNTLFYYMST